MIFRGVPVKKTPCMKCLALPLWWHWTSASAWQCSFDDQEVEGYKQDPDFCTVCDCGHKLQSRAQYPAQIIWIICSDIWVFCLWYQTFGKHGAARERESILWISDPLWATAVSSGHCPLSIFVFWPGADAKYYQRLKTLGCLVILYCLFGQDA